MTIGAPIKETAFSQLNLLRRGKVRDVYEVDDSHLLIVATDRISAFDCILPTPIPRKGEILTAISLFWFSRLQKITAHHLITTDVTQMPSVVQEYAAHLERRSMFVRRTQVLPIECVVRGYLSGSGWKDYLRTGAICGHRFPPGLRESEQLPEPIFTPATKAEHGHDENISEQRAGEIIGRERIKQVRDLSLRLYKEAAEYARTRGIIIADTKFEFGVDADGQVILIDEVLTPDSSRFWPLDRYEPDHAQPSFDKQFVRDYLETLAWNKQPPAPPLPTEVAEATAARYLQAYRLLTGRELQ